MEMGEWSGECERQTTPVIFSGVEARSSAWVRVMLLHKMTPDPPNTPSHPKLTLKKGETLTLYTLIASISLIDLCWNSFIQETLLFEADTLKSYHFC